MPRSARPNILILMADQMAPAALPIHGGAAKAPNIARLAADGVVFDSAYCNSPLCAPSRFSFLSGRLPSRIGAYDNASQISSDWPTPSWRIQNAAACGWTISRQKVPSTKSYGVLCQSK